MAQPTQILTADYFYRLHGSRAQYPNIPIFHKDSTEIKLGKGSKVLFSTIENILTE